MRLGDLLLRARRVTEEDVARALARGRENGGRLGDNLVAIGAIDERTLSSFIHRIPDEPKDMGATGIDENERRFIDYALDNLRVRKHPQAQPTRSPDTSP
jgi:hypothetical protein